MHIRLVVFDMAGTTVQDDDNVHAALMSAFAQSGMQITRQEANSVMGIAKPVAIQTLLDTKFGIKHNDALTESIYNLFLHEMTEHYRHSPAVKPCEGAEALFEALRSRGVKVCLDTGFSRQIADVILKRLGWKHGEVIDLSVTADEVANGRPHPDMIFRAMKQLDIESASQVAKVGDTIADLEEGTRAGCRLVAGVTSGSTSEQELKQAPHTHLIRELTELHQIFFNQ